jgi:hypothetical protein
MFIYFKDIKPEISEETTISDIEEEEEEEEEEGSDYERENVDNDDEKETIQSRKKLEKMWSINLVKIFY